MGGPAGAAAERVHWYTAWRVHLTGTVAETSSSVNPQILDWIEAMTCRLLVHFCESRVVLFAVDDLGRGLELFQASTGGGERVRDMKFVVHSFYATTSFC